MLFKLSHDPSVVNSDKRNCFLFLYFKFLAYVRDQREVWLASKKQTDATGFCDALKAQNNGTVNYFMCFP